MTAEIISVGTELLLGDITNTNAQYLAKQLAVFGINLYRQTVVGDNPKRLKDAFRSAFETADMVITTGGLGPTEDDLTKEIAAEYFGRKMVLHEPSLESIKNYFGNMGVDMPANNVKQAYIPEGSEALPNGKGTAPGCLLEENGKIIITLPGPPFEMKAMFESGVIPYLKKKQDCVFVSRVLRLCGIGESAAEERILDLLDSQTNPTIAPYAKSNEVILRITAKAESEQAAAVLIEPVAKELYDRFGDLIYAEGETTLEETVVSLLKEKNLTISFAESCTGGLLTARLVNVSGVSDVLMEGAVTYSNNAKISRLGVSEASLNNYGAVSSQVAVEMARGVAKTAKTSVGVSTTGIAGPDGGTDEKPVGLVFIGLHINGETTYKQLNLAGDRERIRNRTVAATLDFIRRSLIYSELN